MKNLNLIYLIPALIVLVWGCGEQGAKETAIAEINEPDSLSILGPKFLPGTHCIDLSTFDLNEFWNPAYSWDQNQNVTINKMNPNPTNTILYPHQPLLTSDTTQSGIDYQVVFKLENMKIVPNGGKDIAVVKYYAASKMLAVTIDVESDQNNSAYYQLSGNTNFIPNYAAGAISSVVAVIRYPDNTIKEYNYVVNQLTDCDSYSRVVSPRPMDTSFLAKASYQTNLDMYAAAHVYATKNSNLTSIKNISLFIPVLKGMGLNDISWKLQHNDYWDYRIELQATESNDATNTNGYIYHYFGDIATLVGVPSHRNLTEVDVIIVSQNGTVKKRVKIIVQSTDNHGFTYILEPTDTTGRILID